MPSLSIKTFHLVKDGNAESEYEDALAHDVRRARFAVADGATESAFAALWAEIVVKGFVGSSEAQSTAEWLAAARAKWQEKVPWGTLPWYGKEKARLGSFCAFLGLWFPRAPGLTGVCWRAVAIGDCCLFHVRAERLLGPPFPLTKSAEFGNRPPLVGSLPTPRHPLPRGLKGLAGTGQAGDRFLLVSDALAQCLLRTVELGSSPWIDLQRLVDQEQFRGWVAALRTREQMRNDDVSLLILEV